MSKAKSFDCPVRGVVLYEDVTYRSLKRSEEVSAKHITEQLSSTDQKRLSSTHEKRKVSIALLLT